MPQTWKGITLLQSQCLIQDLFTEPPSGVHQRFFWDPWHHWWRVPGIPHHLVLLCTHEEDLFLKLVGENADPRTTVWNPAVGMTIPEYKMFPLSERLLTACPCLQPSPPSSSSDSLRCLYLTEPFCSLLRDVFLPLPLLHIISTHHSRLSLTDTPQGCLP